MKKVKPTKNTLIGKEVSFIAERITVGNPVTGVLLKEDKEDITVKLTKKIEGIVNIWEKGEERTFRKCLIDNITLK